MKIFAEGATDGAHIALFWCNNMPSNTKELIENGSFDLALKLEDEGKLIHFPVDGDGDYTVSININEPVDEHLKEYISDKTYFKTILVSGDGYFGGGEYMSDNIEELAGVSYMCQKVSIPDGKYKATLYEFDLPAEHDRDWLDVQCSEEDLKLWDSHGSYMAYSIMLILAGIVSIFISWKICLIILSLGGLLMFKGLKMMGSESYKRVEDSQKEYRETYPDFVVTFASEQ